MTCDRPRRHWITLLLLGVLTAAAQAPAQEAEAESPRPRAVVPEPVHDLGELSYGTERTHVFVVRNEGDAPLSIHRVESSCTCAASEYDEEIPPGGQGEIEMSFRAETEPGPLAVRVGVITNDPESARLELTLKADIEYHIYADPGYVRYIVYRGFEADSAVVQHLWAADGEGMRVTGVESPYEFVSASFREASPEERTDKAETDEQWLVETRIASDAPVGPLTGAITIHIDHPHQKVVDIPLHGFVRPMFAVTPPVLDLRTVESGKAHRASLHVKNFASEEIEVTGAETTVEGLEVVEIVEHEPGRVYYVVFTTTPELAEGELSGKVRIKTASPKEPLLEVPVQGTVTAPQA